MQFDIFFEEYVRRIKKLRKNSDTKDYYSKYYKDPISCILIFLSMILTIIINIFYKCIPSKWLQVLIILCLILVLSSLWSIQLENRRRRIRTKYLRDSIDITRSENLDPLQNVLRLEEFSYLNNYSGYQWLLSQTKRRIEMSPPRLRITTILGVFVGNFLYPFIISLELQLSTSNSLDLDTYLAYHLSFIIIIFTISMCSYWFLIEVDSIRNRKLIRLLILEESITFLCINSNRRRSGNFFAGHIYSDD